MKTLTLTFLLVFMIIGTNISAQDKNTPEQFGRTLNLGIGIGGYAGYYGYVGHIVPVFHADYELNVVRNFTLAPFVSFYTYKNEYYWGDHNTPERYYYYRETVIPIGIKGTYYFDQLLNASPKWDFYLAGSAGFAIVSHTWESGYDGNRNYYHDANPLFLDLHAGAEYHINNKVGVFLDLSTGVSTIGFAIH